MSVLSAVFNTLQSLPGTCMVCHRWPAQPLCDACLQRHARSQPRCPTCARPMPEFARPCGTCMTRRGGPLLQHCVAAVDYGYPWDELIARFKFRGEPGLAGPLAAVMLGEPAMRPLMCSVSLVAPVPITPERLAQRGYNQAWELVKGLRQRTGPGCAPALADALLRVGSAPDQHRLPAEQRLHNLKHAFKVHPDRRTHLQGAHVLLIDDVSTTGTTLRSAASALLASGASAVSAAVLAHTA